MKTKHFGRKLQLNKTTVTQLTDMETIKAGGDDFDTPTVNDNCNTTGLVGPIRTYQNTFCICNPDDWCGYYHETNCLGPLFTVV